MQSPSNGEIVLQEEGKDVGGQYDRGSPALNLLKMKAPSKAATNLDVSKLAMKTLQSQHNEAASVPLTPTKPEQSSGGK